MPVAVPVVLPCQIRLAEGLQCWGIEKRQLLIRLCCQACDAKYANVPIIGSPERAQCVVLAPIKRILGGQTLRCDSNVDKSGAAMHLFGNDAIVL